MTTTTTARQRMALLIGLSYVAFVSLGLPDGLIGVGWPSMRATFGLPIDALGAHITTFTIGYLTSSALGGQAVQRLGVGLLLVLSCLATGMSLVVYGSTPVWWLLVAFGLLSGAGAGAIDTGLNTYAAHNFSARVMNWMHAFFGVGAATGPLVMTAVLTNQLSWRIGFLIVGSVQILLALCFWFTREQWRDDSAAEEKHNTASISMLHTIRIPGVWLSILMFVFYTGTEIVIGQWGYTLLTESRGVEPALAGTVISLYWASLTIGRIVFGGLAGRFAVPTMLMVCFVCIVLGTALIWVNAGQWLTIAGFVLAGFTLAPVFPSLMTLTPARFGARHTANVVGFQVAAAALGGAGLSALSGVLARLYGLEVIGLILFLAALLLIVLFVLLNRVRLQTAE